MSAVAGWYTDPSGVSGQLRWWDGERWTDHVTPDPAFAPAQQPQPEATSAAEVTADPVDTTEPEVTAQPDVTPEPEPAAEVPPEPESSPEPDPDPEPEPAPEPAARTVPPPGPVAGAPVWGSGDTGGAGGAGGPGAPASPSGPGTPPPGAPVATPVWGQTQAGYAPTPGPASWEPVEPARSGSGVRTGLIVAAVVAVVVLAGVAFVFVGLLGGVATIDTDDFGITSDDVAFGGEVQVGDVVDGRVPRDGAFEVDLVIDRFSDVTIDVRGQGSFDAVAELVDESGDTRAFNDDRGGSGVQRIGGDDLDPLLEVDLEAGTYRLSIRGFSGESGAFEVSIS